jgi:hypothetical protein
MTTVVITTFSVDGYELYGHRMIETWLKYWPSDTSLLVYTEGYDLVEVDPRLSSIDINHACPDLEKFKTNSKQLIKNPADKKFVNRVAKTIKWCHKVFAMHHALNNVPCDYLVFLDGDTYSKNPIPNTIAEQLVESHLFAVHFEKLQHGLHFETGLISFNLKHLQMTVLKDELISDYINLKIYEHKKTWDGFWFAYLYKKNNFDVLDLSGGRFTGVFTNKLIKNLLVHEAGNDKYIGKNFDRYSGRKIS